MSIQQVLTLQLDQINSQIAAYQADINNLLPMLAQLNQSQQVIVQWLASNPSQ